MGAVRVYVCDDAAELRHMVRAALEDDPRTHVVGEAGEARTAIAEISQEQPDVVLLDLAMPEIDGLEALPKVKAAAPDAAVIIFSGLAAARMAPLALANGADRYIEKGEEIEYVRETILELAA